jgi:hypothetical protein
MSQYKSHAAVEVGLPETAREFLAPAPLADPSMRAGQHTISDLERMLGAVLVPDSARDADSKWLPIFGVAIVLSGGAILWAGIIFGMAKLF